MILQQNFSIVKWTIIFQTARHFTSASRQKFSHDNFYTDVDWIFNIQENCISNRKPTNTLTSPIQCAFREYLKDFTKHMDSNIVPKNTSNSKHWCDIQFEYCLCVTLHFQSNFLCTVCLIEVCVLFTTKLYSTHTKMGLVIVLFGLCLCLIFKFHWDWRPNRCLYYDRRVKIWFCSLKRSVTLFGKWL